MKSFPSNQILDSLEIFSFVPNFVFFYTSSLLTINTLSTLNYWLNLFKKMELQWSDFQNNVAISRNCPLSVGGTGEETQKAESCQLCPSLSFSSPSAWQLTIEYPHLHCQQSYYSTHWSIHVHFLAYAQGIEALYADLSLRFIFLRDTSS